MGKIVVVGAGQAGASLVATLRSEGWDGDITLIGEEDAPPYQRPPLSKAYLLGDMPRERLFLRPESFYAEQGIDLRIGTRVTGIDRAAKRVGLENGEALDYDHLALTTGSSPRALPSAIGGDMDGVYVLRTLGCVDKLSPVCKPGAHVLVVGGGYIGLEAAAVCAKIGMKVTLIEMAERILNRVASDETAAYFRDLHSERGVEILEGCGLTRLEGDGHVAQAVLSDGTHLDVDLVLAGIGIVPNVELADAAGLDLDNGIAVNALGQTSDLAIWSAGDCASLPWRGVRLRLESVQNAIEQAEVVAKNMLGAAVEYDPHPWFWSDQYDVKLQIAGLNSGYDRLVVRGDGPSRSHWYYKGDRLIAVDAMNDARGYMVGKRLIESGKSPAPEAVADRDTDLKALLRG
ncbi:MAG: FAD-dependent oxidoreductase [Pseudomonadota bacterium]